jgi:hypothetical protein
MAPRATNDNEIKDMQDNNKGMFIPFSNKNNRKKQKTNKKGPMAISLARHGWRGQTCSSRRQDTRGTKKARQIVIKTQKIGGTTPQKGRQRRSCPQN